MNAPAHRPWLATYRQYGIPEQINADAHPSVTALMDQAIQTFAAKTALRCFGQSLSYADVDRLSAACCAYLQQRLGIRRGDRVAVMLPNLAAFPIVLLGILRAGAVQVNVNPLYTPRELELQLNDSRAEVIVVFAGSTPVLAQAMAQTGVRTVITVEPADGLPQTLPSPPVDPRLQGAIGLRQVLDEGAALQRIPVQLTGEDLLFLQYTGGTTGLSKGAALSHRNLIANTEQFKAFMPQALRPGQEVVITAIPLYHILALMVNMVSYFSVGAENWLVPNPRDMDGFIDTLQQSRCTIFIGVNTLFNGLTLHPRIGEVDFSALRLTAGGGAAVLPSTSAKWREVTGLNIKEGYGLSETSPILTINPMTTEAFTGTTGLPVPSTDIKLLGDDDQEVPVGAAGEVCAKGPQVMQGYWDKPEINASAFTADGYFRTGDIGVFDERGFLKIVDRKKDIVLVSGFNVYPTEVEVVASAIAGVAECACVGVPDAKSGEAVKLFVVKLPGAELSAEAVQAHCRSGLAGYKVPKIVSFVEVLPKSNVGKVLRRELRDGHVSA